MCRGAVPAEVPSPEPKPAGSPLCVSRPPWNRHGLSKVLENIAPGAMVVTLLRGCSAQPAAGFVN